MYPPAISYEVYKVEHEIALTRAQRRAADEQAGRVAATLGQQWQAVVRVLTLARPRQRRREWNVVDQPASRQRPTRSLHPGGANIVAISTRKIQS
jgi:hypothetical protein